MSKKSHSSDPRLMRVRARDVSADGSFVYCVRTTRIYCRPSCPARRPRAENIDFHLTPADAERAGYRPCKRCKPETVALATRRTAQITELCKMLDGGDRRPSLGELARHVGLSPFHTHRLFKAMVGLTPGKYAAARREMRVRRTLRSSATITEAIYRAGYNSSGRFYDAAGELLGMTPGNYRAGGTDSLIRFGLGKCALGLVLVAASARGVCAVLLGDDRKALVDEIHRLFPHATRLRADGSFERTLKEVISLVDNPAGQTALPLDVRGTVFQKRVWDALRAIPVGARASYTDIARSIGAPLAVRAVASACASNVLAVVIPCHRAVRKNGDVSGYRWGTDRKTRLLDREARAARATRTDAQRG